jgi:hypothetical protein
LIQLGVINILTIFALRNRRARHFITVQINDSRSKVLHAVLSVIVSLKCGVKQRLSYFYNYVVTCRCVRGCLFVCLFVCLFGPNHRSGRLLLCEFGQLIEIHPELHFCLERSCLVGPSPLLSYGVLLCSHFPAAQWRNSPQCRGLVPDTMVLTLFTQNSISALLHAPMRYTGLPMLSVLPQKAPVTSPRPRLSRLSTEYRVLSKLTSRLAFRMWPVKQKKHEN